MFDFLNHFQGRKSLERDAIGFSGQLWTVLVDVTKDESVKNVYNFVVDRLKSGQYIWAVVNNAGTATSYGPAEWVSMEQFKEVFDVNTLGQIRVIKAFLPLIKASKGRICSTTSVLGRMSAPYHVSYTMSKHAMEGFMDTLRIELKPFGIKCCIFEPGSFKTRLAIKPGFWEGLIERTWENATGEQKEEYGEEFKNEMIRMRSTAVHTYPENTDAVVNAYFHAVTAKYPRARYACGDDAKFYFVLLSLVFPTELQDWIHERMKGRLMNLLPAAIRKSKIS